MNFGKKSVSEKHERLNSTSAKVGKSAGVTALRALFFGLMTVLAIVICLGVGAFKGLIDSAPDISDVNIMPMGYATFVYDADGNEIQKLNSSDGNRISVSIDEIPLHMQHAIVAIEDARFYEHHGIDPRGIARAVVVAIKNKGKATEGASTLTQQLLKNNVFTDWTTEGTIDRWKRKFQEQYLALELEASLTAEGKDAKSVILENYLNTVNFGAGAYGVQTASQTYFGKNCSELTLSECAVLAAIPQNPTKYNPKRHPDYNSQRRAKVLKNMLEQNYITQQEYDEALADDVYSRIVQDSAETTEQPYSYFMDALISQLTEDLMTQKGYTAVQAKNAIYSGGLRIYTTQDPAIQQIMDEEYQNPDNFPEGVEIGLDWALTLKHSDGSTTNYSREMLQKYFRDQGDESFDLNFGSQEEAQAAVDAYKAAVITEGDTIQAERISFTPQPQSSMVIIDQHTGYVKALVGGRGEKTASLTLNRATDTYAQPGSTFKILSTYGPALDMGEITLSTIVRDEPYSYETGTPIKNSDGQYHGDISIRNAITISDNIVAVKTLTEITPQAGFNYLLRMGFDKLENSTASDVRQPLALGGITNGVTTLQLAAAYAAIANSGDYLTPVLYTKVLDQDGNVILDNSPAETNVFKESTAYLLTSAMEDVVKSGTGTMCQLDNMSVAGKTGTTTSARSLFFVGYTPYYTCAVWAGYDSNAAVPKGSQNFHKQLWQSVMSRIHEDLPDVGFEKPSSVKEATICSETGLLATSTCSSVTEYYSVDTIPTKRCSGHYVAPPEPEPTPEPVPEVTPDPAQGQQTVPGETTTPPQSTQPAQDPGVSVPPDSSEPTQTPDTGEGGGQTDETVPETPADTTPEAPAEPAPETPSGGDTAAPAGGQ